MKKISMKVVACLMAGSLMSTSCIGSFSLFNKYAHWQRTMTSNKYVNAIVGFFLMPIIGGITLFVDSVVLNTIEFWSGDNPLASNIGKTQNVFGEDGKLYAVKTLKDGYEVTAPNGEVTLLTYDKVTDSWSISQNGMTKELFRFNADGQSISVNVNGEQKDFTLNKQGVFEAQMIANDGLFFAQH